jgi:hypothetical protein
MAARPEKRLRAQRINVRLSGPEYAQLLDNARRLGVTPTAACRVALRLVDFIPAPAPDLKREPRPRRTTGGAQ